MYTTVANIQNRRGIPLTDGQIAYFNDVLSPAIDSFINQATGTAFSSPDAPVDVYADGSCSNMLIIPTMHDITSVQSLAGDGTATVVDPTYYVAYPTSSTNKLAIRNRTSVWNEGFENYIVTGKLGYSDVPADIVMVATEMALLTFTKNPDMLKRERVGDWDVIYADAKTELSDDTLAILNTYHRLSRSV